MNRTNLMRLDVFKQVSEDWYGPFRIARDKRYEGAWFVRVSLMELPFAEPVTYRVCVWGNDDFGMEFDTPSLDIARELYTALVLTEDLRQDTLTELGFVRA